MDSAQGPPGWKTRHGTYPQWITAIAAIAAFALGLYNLIDAQSERNFKDRVNSQIDEKLTPINFKFNDLSEKLAKLEGIVETLSRPSAFKSISELKPSEFAKALPDLRKITHQLLSPGTPLDQQAIQNVASKLREIPETSPDYWPTVLQFIHFVSAGQSPHVPPPGPPTMRIRSSFDIKVIESNKVVLLDGGGLVNSTFTNCRIVFTEQPVKMQNVLFINCLFEMPVTATPTPYLKRAAKELLVADLKRVSITSL